ncbi:HXXEE domain-containing protein [Candidatus Kaiserbacteria bacterium]|nr:HXXEE domain-containing protein [Candidatus Kaiserbacteria bacterium]
MISTRLKIIFALSIPFFIVHGAEEYLTHFYDIDSSYHFVFGWLASASAYQAMFATFEVMLWILFVVALLLLLGERSRFWLLGIVGIIYVFELHHIIKALLAWSYYPGLITSFAFPIFAFLFWKEWMRLYYHNRIIH